MLRHRGFEPDVISPPKPRIAIEDVSHVVKSHRRLLVLSVARVIDTTIDQRVGFRFEHVMPARDFNPVFVVLARRLEVIKLTINPANAVRETRMPEQITV